MKIRFVLFSVVLACLAACSSGPSTSEAKEAILSQIGGGCSRLSIKDFAKVNGAADGGTAYQISVKYLLVVEPPASSDDRQDAFDAQIKDIEQRTQQAQQGLTDAQTADDAFEHSQHPAGWYPKAADLDQENALQHQIDDKRNLLQSLDAEKRALWAEPSQHLSSTCPNLSDDIVSAINAAARDYDRANPGKSAYLNGFEIAMADTVNLIKTDNGWKVSL
jgi:hypothetical protein